MIYKNCYYVVMSPTSYQTAPPRIMWLDYIVMEFKVKAFLIEFGFQADSRWFPSYRDAQGSDPLHSG